MRRIKSLAARCRELDTEAARLGRHVDIITATAAPELRAIYGVGPDTAATLLTALGDNPNRIGSDAAFAKLCGVSPLEASSGKTIRHRLNRGGSRDANRALHVVLVVRMRRHGPTRDYFARRLAEGKTNTDTPRILAGQGDYYCDRCHPIPFVVVAADVGLSASRRCLRLRAR